MSQRVGAEVAAVPCWSVRDGPAAATRSARRPGLRKDFKVANATIYESEMPLFPECTPWCAPNVLDTADIVLDPCFRQFSAIHDITRSRGRVAHD